MVIPLIELYLRKKEGKKTNSPGFYTELDLSWNRAGPGAGEVFPILYQPLQISENSQA